MLFKYKKKCKDETVANCVKTMKARSYEMWIYTRTSAFYASQPPQQWSQHDAEMCNFRFIKSKGTYLLS